MDSGCTRRGAAAVNRGIGAQQRSACARVPRMAAPFSARPPVSLALVVAHPTPDATPQTTANSQTDYAVDRFGSMPVAGVRPSLVRDVDLDTVAEASATSS